MVSIFKVLTFIVSTIGYKQRNDSNIDSSKSIPGDKLLCSLYCNNWILKLNTTSELESSTNMCVFIWTTFSANKWINTFRIKGRGKKMKMIIQAVKLIQN